MHIHGFSLPRGGGEGLFGCRSGSLSSGAVPNPLFSVTHVEPCHSSHKHHLAFHSLGRNQNPGSPRRLSEAAYFSNAGNPICPPNRTWLHCLHVCMCVCVGDGAHFLSAGSLGCHTEDPGICYHQSSPWSSFFVTSLSSPLQVRQTLKVRLGAPKFLRPSLLPLPKSPKLSWN